MRSPPWFKTSGDKWRNPSAWSALLGKHKPVCNTQTPLHSLPKGPLGMCPVPVSRVSPREGAGLWRGCPGPGEEASWLSHLLAQSWGRRAPPSIWWGSALCCSCEISLQALESTSKIFLSILLLQNFNDSASLGWQELRASLLTSD